MSSERGLSNRAEYSNSIDARSISSTDGCFDRRLVVALDREARPISLNFDVVLSPRGALDHFYFHFDYDSARRMIRALDPAVTASRVSSRINVHCRIFPACCVSRDTRVFYSPTRIRYIVYLGFPLPDYIRYFICGRKSLTLMQVEIAFRTGKIESSIRPFQYPLASH